MVAEAVRYTELAPTRFKDFWRLPRRAAFGGAGMRSRVFQERSIGDTSLEDSTRLKDDEPRWSRLSLTDCPSR
jgi:hypothetical protein